MYRDQTQATATDLAPGPEEQENEGYTPLSNMSPSTPTSLNQAQDPRASKQYLPPVSTSSPGNEAPTPVREFSAEPYKNVSFGIDDHLYHVIDN